MKNYYFALVNAEENMEKISVHKIIEDFRKDHRYLFDNGAEIRGVFGEMEDAGSDGEISMGISVGFNDEDMVNPFKCHISLWVNFFTDHRKIPKFYKGVKVLTVVDTSTEPEEFKFDDGTREFIPLEEIKMPERYEDYVRYNADLIREKLGDYNMTYQDMLDALCWGDFEKYRRDYYSR